MKNSAKQTLSKLSEQSDEMESLQSRARYINLTDAT
jgi:hypothetical protein